MSISAERFRAALTVGGILLATALLITYFLGLLLGASADTLLRATVSLLTVSAYAFTFLMGAKAATAGGMARRLGVAAQWLSLASIAMALTSLSIWSRQNESLCLRLFFLSLTLAEVSSHTASLFAARDALQRWWLRHLSGLTIAAVFAVAALSISSLPYIGPRTHMPSELLLALIALVAVVSLGDACLILTPRLGLLVARWRS